MYRKRINPQATAHGVPEISSYLIDAFSPSYMRNLYNTKHETKNDFTTDFNNNGCGCQENLY